MSKKMIAIGGRETTLWDTGGSVIIPAGVEPGDFIVMYNGTVHEVRDEGHSVRSIKVADNLAEFEKTLRLEPVRAGLGRLLDSMYDQFPKLAEKAAQEAEQPEEWDYDMTLANFEAGTGRV